MRKVVMLSAAAILGIASIAVSQAEDVAGTSTVTVSDVAEGQEVVDNLPEKLGDDTKAAAVTTDGEAATDEAAQVDGEAAAETAAAAPAAEEKENRQERGKREKFRQRRGKLGEEQKAYPSRHATSTKADRAIP